MKKLFRITLLTIIITSFSCTNTRTKKVVVKELTIENYTPTKEELGKRMQWFDNVRFGMFIHWGVYSPLSGTWEGVKYQGYGEHIQRMAKIPVSVYKEKVAGMFNPVKFDAEEWIRLAKDAGMGYFVFTAKHHDGFAMYDSKVSDYNIVKATPFGRDPMKELETACRKAGIKFGVYYSQAFDWGEENGPGNDWDYDNPGGDKLLGGRNWWENRRDFIPKARKYVDEKVIPQLMEIIENYKPDLIWFDTPHKLPEEENLRIVAAVRNASPDIVINGRAIEACGDYYNTWDRPAEFASYEGYWEGIPTTNNSYAYNANDTVYKTASHFVRLLAKASARGGNILMNIGPKGDGSIDNRDSKILNNIAKWWKVNGESSIRGTQRTPLTVQSWGESTLKGNTLYLHVFELPKDGKLIVGGLLTDIKKVYLLCNKINQLKTTRIGKDVVIEIPAGMSDTSDIVVAIECMDTPEADPYRLLSTSQPSDKLRVFDAMLYGGIKYGGEAERQIWVEKWTDTEDKVTWPVRLNKKASYEVFINYAATAPQKSGVVEGDAGKEMKVSNKGAGGRYTVLLNNQKLSRNVSHGDYIREKVGEVTLDKGEFNICIIADKITGEELFRPRSIELKIKSPIY